MESGLTVDGPPGLWRMSAMAMCSSIFGPGDEDEGRGDDSENLDFETEVTAVLRKQTSFVLLCPFPFSSSFPPLRLVLSTWRIGIRWLAFPREADGEP